MNDGIQGIEAKKKEIQIGCKMFAPTLIKWKHKKRMHFEIETAIKVLAHLIR